MELHPARNIDSLDGLRGFACLLVVLGHLAKEELIFDIKGIGQLGVMLFFVLSGFLMALLYTDQRLNAERLSVYAVRRVFRVVPAYVAVAVLSFLICQFYDNFGYHVDAHALVGLLTFSTQLSVFWTIPVEMKFYAFFPLLWLVLAYIRSDYIRFGLMFAAFVALLVVDLPGTRLSLTKHIEYFIGGMAAAYASRILPTQHRWQQFSINMLLFIALLLIVLLIPQVFLHLFKFEHHMWDNSEVIAPVFVLTVTACSLCSGWLLQVFSNRFARYLGAISFSLYLVHYPCVYFAHTSSLLAWAPHVIQIFVALLLALNVATLLYRNIEVPCRQLGLRGCLWLQQQFRSRAGAVT